MTKIIVQNPTPPSLLLSPDESRDRNGPVTPDVGTDVSIVQGEYGDAWKATNGRTAQSFVSYNLGSLTTAPTPQEGTVILRASGFDPGLASNQYLFRLGGVTTAPSLYLQGVGGNLRFTQNATGTPVYSTIAPLPTNVPFIVVIRWSNGTATVRLIHAGGDTSQVVALGTFTHTAFPDISTTLSTLNSSVAFESIVLFADALSDAEIQRIATMDEAWTWKNASLTERMVDTEIDVAVPKGKSGLNIIETKVYESNMFGVTGREIPVTNAKMTSDIDRAGSKTRVELETVSLDPEYKYSIGPGRWVSVFQEIARENEGIERVQRGVFELGQPTVRSKAQRDNVHNSGNDVVDRLARASVLDTFYTPVRGYVMGDIETAIRMLGITSMGPNLLTNGSFENEGTGWGFSGYSGGSAVDQYQPMDGTPVPDGASYANVTFNSTTTAGGYIGFRQTGVPIPPEARRIYSQAMVYAPGGGGIEVGGSIRFADAAGVEIATNTRISIGSWDTPVSPVSQWVRIVGIGDVPDWAVSATFWMFVRDAVGGRVARMKLDDFRMCPCTGDLLPESVLALPTSEAMASSRIQHLPGATLLSAVNDRLASIGMMAVHATPDSKFTSRQARDTATDATVRTFHLNKDVRMIGDVTIERSVTSMYNRVFAIKEDFTTGESMIAIAENDNVSDPWSIHNILLEPKIVTSQDAADLQVLQDLADAELARASVQTSIKFGILPDPALTVYDMIYIEGPPGHRAVGRWAIESIESGLTTDNPLMIIGARRSTR